MGASSQPSGAAGPRPPAEHGALHASAHPPHHPLLDVVGPDRGVPPRAAALALAAVAAFAAGIGAVRAAVPGDAVVPEDVRVRLAACERAAADTDVLMLGSSVVFRHLDPRVVDARLAERGHALRSLNAGLPASFVFETDVILRRVLAAGAGRVRWVVLECRPHDPDLEEFHRLTQRGIWWHEPAAMPDVLRACWNWGLRPGRRAEAFGVHVQHAFIAQARLGAGPDAIAIRSDAARARVASRTDEVLAARGFVPLDAATEEREAGARRHADLLARWDEFARRRDLLAAGRLKSDAGAWMDAGAVRRQVAACRAAGVEPVHFLGPLLETHPEIDRLAQDGTIPHLLAFNDPARFPELYEKENRFDFGHLNARGAEILSRRFADLFADVLEGRRP